MDARDTVRQDASLDLLTRYGAMTAARVTKIKCAGWRYPASVVANEKALLDAMVADGRLVKTGAKYAAA